MCCCSRRARPIDSDSIRVPAGVAQLFHSQFDWDYSNLPRNRSRTAGAIHLPRGRALGGFLVDQLDGLRPRPSR